MNSSPAPLEGNQQSAAGKQPRIVLRSDSSHPHIIYAFPPNRETLGSTAYLIVGAANILVDCPAWNPVNQAFLQAQGGVDWLFLTHRGGMGQVREIQAALQCQVAVQEQEAYLLPGLSLVTFERSLTLTADIHALWTAGHSPGSACLYDRNSSGVLFTGRHLLPNPQGQLMPLKTAKTFHWRRQLQNVQQVLDTFTPETLQTICPGANLGFLRGRQKVDRAYEQLAQLDLEALESAR